MKTTFIFVFLVLTPVASLAQGVSIQRDARGNLIRDNGLSGPKRLPSTNSGQVNQTRPNAINRSVQGVKK